MTIKEFETLNWEHECSKTSMPKQYVPITKFKVTTANGLTKAITTFLNISGHQAERISSSGRVIDNTKIVTDMIGMQRKIGSMTYIKGTSTNGTADISATIKVKINERELGLSVKWEVKMKDKQSLNQKKYEENITKAGGYYFICHTFEEFMNQYKSIINEPF